MRKHRMDCRNFQKTHADDGIHDDIMFNEYRPHGSWMEHYRRKDDLRDLLLAGFLVALLVIVYVTESTLAFYWG